MAVYAYYRVSTQTQAEQNGIEMQKNVIEKYCCENDIVLAGEFQDLGVSGTVIDREGLTELLSVLEKGDIIIVQNTSRLWRDYYATAIIRKAIEQSGADVISIEQSYYNIQYKDPSEFLIVGLMELLDQWDKLTISTKLAKGRNARAKSGHKPCGTAPYGYRWQGNKIVIDYNNNLIVKDIFEKYIDLKSLSKLKQYCDDRGYKTSTGRDFSKQSLKNIIENDFYIGIVTYAERKISGKHEILIEKEVFDKANEILKR